MASVSRVNGRFKVRWRVNGQARSKTFDTLEQATEFRLQIESDVFVGRAVTERMRLSTWAESWYANRLGLRETTRVRNLSLYHNHIKHGLGNVFLDDLTTPIIQSFITSLTKKKSGKDKFLAPTTIREIYQELDKCLTAATHARLLRDNPCHGITLPKVEHQDMHFLNQLEVKQLAESIDPRYSALIYVLAYAGLRIGEAAALTPADITDKGISVSKSTSEVQGKLITNHPKTKAGRRIIPIPQFIVQTLEDHMSAYPGDYVFTGRDGGQIRSNVFRQRQFKTARDKINRPELRIHDLRHTAVSFWIDQGVDLLRIKKWAGHTNSTFTLDRYGHLIEESHDQILAKLNQNIQEVHAKADSTL